LTQIFRQSDREFIDMLERIRMGKDTDRVKVSTTCADCCADVDTIHKYEDTLLQRPSNTKGAVEIYPLRNDVEHINNARIDALPSQALEFQCKDFFNYKPDHRKKHPEFKMSDVV
jgi:hypothetical protein